MADATTYTKILYYGNYADLPATRDANKLYFCVDNGKLYKGDVDFSDSFKTVTSATIPAAAAAVPGFIYYESDTHKFKTLLGGALVEIGNPIDAVGDSTTHTLSASSADDHVPSSKNVWLYGQAIKAEVVGGQDVVKNVADAADPAKFTVTYGDDSTSEVELSGVYTGVEADTTDAGKINFTVAGDTTESVTIPGVVTGLTANATDAAKLDIALTDGTAEVVVPGVFVDVTGGTSDAQLVFTDSDDATAAVTVPGVVTTPTWDETALKLTLPVSGGTAIEVNIPKDIFLESGSYDVTNKQIVLVLNDASSTEIRFSVSDLIPIYEAGDTTTVDTEITWDSTNGKYVVSSNVNLSDATTNVITTDANGLLVDGTQFASATDFATLEASHNNLAAVAGWTSFTA